MNEYERLRRQTGQYRRDYQPGTRIMFFYNDCDCNPANLFRCMKERTMDERGVSMTDKQKQVSTGTITAAEMWCLGRTAY